GNCAVCYVVKPCKVDVLAIWAGGLDRVSSRGSKHHLLSVQLPFVRLHAGLDLRLRGRRYWRCCIATKMSTRTSSLPTWSRCPRRSLVEGRCEISPAGQQRLNLDIDLFDFLKDPHHFSVEGRHGGFRMCPSAHANRFKLVVSKPES